MRASVRHKQGSNSTSLVRSADWETKIHRAGKSEDGREWGVSSGVLSKNAGGHDRGIQQECIEPQHRVQPMASTTVLGRL